MKAAVYQFTPAFGEKDNNMGKVLSAVENIEADLLVLPEFFATGYQFISREEVAGLSETVPHGKTTRKLIDLSRRKGMYVVAGLPERNGNIYYNSAVITGPKGFVGLYRKTHLFFEEKNYFSPGDTGFSVWKTDIGRIGIMICFDWFYPESMRTLALMGAEVVAHPSNLVLPFCPDAMPVRCLENMTYALTANRTGTEQRKDGCSLTFIGKSEIVSPRGEILVRAPGDREMLIVHEIDLALSRDKALNPFNDIFMDRRPDKYGPMFEDR